MSAQCSEGLRKSHAAFHPTKLSGVTQPLNGWRSRLECPRLPRPQSALMPVNLTTLPHFSVSSAMSLPKSAGDSVLTHFIRNHAGRNSLISLARDHTPEKIVAVVGYTV